MRADWRTVLSIATAVNVVKALIRGDDAFRWSEVSGVALAVFFMGFLCGVIAWSGKGLHKKFGAIGDALVGMAVFIAFFTCCMLLFAPELLGAKLHDGGLPMLGVAALAGVIAGIWFGHDLDDETSTPGT